MKQLLLLLLFIFPADKKTSAQQSLFYCDVGASLFFPWEHEKDAAVFPTFTFTPGLRLAQNKNFALVLSCPLSAGGTFKNDTYLGIDVPAMVSIHIGSAAANNNNSKLGFILGAGAGYINVVNFYEDRYFEKVHTEFWGYRFNASMSFKADEKTGGVPAIMLSFGRSINGKDAYMVGISFHYITSN